MIRFLRQASKKTITGTALVRLDFNTADEWRMRATLPTVQHLLKYSAKIVIVSHRGRPHGAEAALSLRKKAKDLERLLRRKVNFIPHFDFEKICRQIDAAPRGSVFVLENVRFLKGEVTPTPELARSLASLADFYVNDAFAVAHHPSDSVARIEKFLPSYAGLELEQEIKYLSQVMKKAPKPLVFILGGAKADDKLGILRYFKLKADAFLIGGAAANTLLFLKGVDVQKSLIQREPQVLRDLREVVEYPNVILPLDWKMRKGMILDIGPKTVKVFSDVVSKAQTVIWSGPLGLIERAPFGEGTLAIGKVLAKNKKALKITGGGETVTFFKKHKLDTQFTFISTGGGALIEYLEGKKLPGIEALERSKRSKARR